MAERTGWSVPFRVIAPVHALLVVGQALLAGALLDAVDGATAWHGGVGGVLILVGMVQAVAAVPAVRPGGMPAWVLVVALLLPVAETAQVSVGYFGHLAVHVPLGIAILGAQLALAWAAAHPRVRSGRSTRSRPRTA
ncbi:hypothetical protein WCD74_08105 [Actinomycetospora sp. OC33-EN08]|uniref:Uncharacterized protein n=1 Tax=Actinomycetospora aurantiaca TaxID=3129233 RepID=A0ABU8MK77_9PSEU